MGGVLLPDASSILSDGQKAQTDSPGEYTARGLEAETDYLIVAAARNADIYSKVVSIRMTTSAQTGPSPEQPSLTITPGETTSSSLTFTVAPSEGVDLIAFMCVKKGESLPATTDELFDGDCELIDDPRDPVRVEELDYDTSYVIVAGAAAGDLLSELATLEMKTQAAPWTKELTAGRIVCGYFGNANTHGPNGQYVIMMDDIPWGENGYATGAGFQCSVSFHSDYFDDPALASPASGTYTLDPANTYDKWTINTDEYSWWMRTDEQGQELPGGYFLDATLTIAESPDGGFEVTALLKLIEGVVYKMTWNGPLEWEDYIPVLASDKVLSVTDGTGAGTYYGVGQYANPESDRWILLLQDDPQSPTMYLSLDFYTDILDNPLDPVLPSGTFTCNGETNTDAWTFNPGGEMWGDYGTYLKIMERNGEMYSYHCRDGSFTITNNGDGSYRVDCDLITSQGTKITGSYTGNVAITSKYRPAKEEVIFQADRVDEGYGYFYRAGSQDNYYFSLANCELSDDSPRELVGAEEGYLVEFDLYAPAQTIDKDNILIPEGTYVVDFSGSATHTFSPNYTRFWHYDSNGRTRYYVDSGAITVSRDDNGIYTLKAECKDSNGKRLVCNYTGEIRIVTSGANALSVKEVTGPSTFMYEEARLKMIRERFGDIGFSGASGTGSKARYGVFKRRVQAGY